MTAAETVLNSPEAVVPERTTAAPGGGTVRVAAKERPKRENKRRYVACLEKPAIVLVIDKETLDTYVLKRTELRTSEELHFG